jgi:hypothetical protein
VQYDDVVASGGLPADLIPPPPDAQPFGRDACARRVARMASPLGDEFPRLVPGSR